MTPPLSTTERSALTLFFVGAVLALIWSFLTLVDPFFDNGRRTAMVILVILGIPVLIVMVRDLLGEKKHKHRFGVGGKTRSVIDLIEETPFARKERTRFVYDETCVDCGDTQVVTSYSFVSWLLKE